MIVDSLQTIDQYALGFVVTDLACRTDTDASSHYISHRSHYTTTHHLLPLRYVHTEQKAYGYYADAERRLRLLCEMAFLKCPEHSETMQKMILQALQQVGKFDERISWQHV